jgi:uncharacterized Tic20 family protein
MKPNTEERILAVLAHLSVLLMGYGAVLPVALWASQREKSRYAAFQSLQAYGYHSLGYTVWILVYMVVLIFLTLLLVPLSVFAERDSASIDALLAIWMVLMFLSVLFLFAAYLLPPLLGAVMCALGLDFRYPLLGTRLAAFLGYDSDPQAPLPEAAMDSVVAGLGHFLVIFPLWGLLAPAAAWVLEGKRSLFLRFQSAQTVVYQAVGGIISLGLGILYILSVFAFLPIVSAGDDALLGYLLIFGIGWMCLSGLVLLLSPLYHLLGQWAGLQVLRGRDYHYPLLGRKLEQWLFSSPNTNTENP